MVKRCIICKKIKEISDFRKNGKYFQSRCIPCEDKYKKEYYQKNRDHLLGVMRKWSKENKETRAVYQKNWRSKNKERLRELGRNERARLKEEVFSHYGSVCECCGEKNIEFLAIDHINGNGADERRNQNLSGSNMYRHLRKNNYPDGYRLLCHNCNMSIGFFGYCPHRVTHCRG